MVQAQQAEAQKIAAIDLSEREKAQAKQKRDNEKREAETQHLQSIEKESEEVQRRAGIEYARETKQVERRVALHQRKRQKIEAESANWQLMVHAKSKHHSHEFKRRWLAACQKESEALEHEIDHVIASQQQLAEERIDGFSSYLSDTAPPEQETHNQVAPIEEIAKAELLGITSESVFFTVDLFSSDVPVLCYFDSFGSASLSSFARVFPHMRNSADATQSRLGGATLDVLLNAELFAVVSSSKVWDPGGFCSTSCCRTAAANDTDTDESDTTQSELC